LLNPLLNYGRNEDVRKALRGLIGFPQRARMVVPHPTIASSGETQPSCRAAELLQISLRNAVSAPLTINTDSAENSSNKCKNYLRAKNLLTAHKVLNTV